MTLNPSAVGLVVQSAGSGSTDAGTASGSAAPAYAARLDEWSATNQQRLDRHAQLYSKKDGKYWQSKLIGLCRPRLTHNPPATAFSTAAPDAAPVTWGREPAMNFVALLYKQKADWLNPAKIDKLELAHAVYQLEQKDAQGALGAYRAALHLPWTLEEIKKDLGNGAGYYAHRWKPLALDNMVFALGCAVPLAAHADPAALATLHALRIALSILHAWFGMQTGWERVSHFKDREVAAASMVAKALDIFSQAPAPWDAKALAGELAAVAPQLKQELEAALNISDADKMRQLGPKLDEFEQSLERIKAHLYNKAAELKGNKRSLKYRSTSSVIRLVGGVASVATGAKAGPLAGGITVAASLALSLIPHAIYHFTDAGVDDARDKGIALLENNLKMVNRWINTDEFTAAEIAGLYENYTSDPTPDAEARIRRALDNAFNMQVVPAMVELVGGIQATVCEKLLLGKLAKATSTMVQAHRKATSSKQPGLRREHYRREAERCEQRAARLFEDHHRLKRAFHYLDRALQSGDEHRTVELLDQASEAFAAITDEDVHTLLLSRSQQKQVEVMAQARILNKEELFKYGLSYAVAGAPELASIGATIGLSAHAAANLAHGQTKGPRRFYAANLIAAVASFPGYAVSGQRPNLQEAHGNQRSGHLTDQEDMEKSQVAVSPIVFPGAERDAAGAALQAAFAQIKSNGATPHTLQVQAEDLEYSLDFTKTQPFYDEQRDLLPRQDRLRLLGVEGWIALRLLWVAIRAIGPDPVKRHLKATREERREILRLKTAMRERIREQNFELLTGAVNPESEVAKARLREMDMDEFFRVLGESLEQPIKVRVARRYGADPVGSADDIQTWMDQVARADDHLMFRTADGHFATARRDGPGKQWLVLSGEHRIALARFIQDRGAVPVEAAILPFGWRTDVPRRLQDFEAALEQDSARDGRPGRGIPAPQRRALRRRQGQYFHSPDTAPLPDPDPAPAQPLPVRPLRHRQGRYFR